MLCRYAEMSEIVAFGPLGRSRTFWQALYRKNPGHNSQRLPGIQSANGEMAGYPKIFNIEMDPHEDLNVAGLFGWLATPRLRASND